jgi:rubrerythrin
VARPPAWPRSWRLRRRGPQRERAGRDGLARDRHGLLGLRRAARGRRRRHRHPELRLKLEHLEATFYEEAAATGLIKDRRALDLIKDFGETERTHVETLTATVKELGGAPVTQPRTRFELVFQGGPEMILQTAATVENLGAAAYLGQAPRIKSKEILAAALAIHSVEARHAAALNTLVRRRFEAGGPLQGSIPDGPFARPMSMNAVLAEARPFLAN